MKKTFKVRLYDTDQNEFDKIIDHVNKYLQNRVKSTYLLAEGPKEISRNHHGAKRKLKDSLLEANRI